VDTVLVVDDDRGTLDTFGRLLTFAGFHPLGAPTGLEGLEILERQHVDVMLLDLKLPDISGLDVLRRVREHKLDVPTVVMTGFGSVESAVEAMKLGAVDYGSKPLIGDEVERAARRGLEARTNRSLLAAAADGLNRWTSAVMQVVDAAHDPKTLEEWASLICVAPETLRSWCRTVGLCPKPSLDLARLLRAARLAAIQQAPLARFLDAADHRTLERLLAAGGVADTRSIPSLDELLGRQHLIGDAAVVAELRRCIAEKYLSR
jgi:ActR/RegA family two-component response regulator